MTNQEIISTGQTIKTETHIGGNTAERVGGVIEGIGENLKSIGEHNYISFDVAAGSSTPTTQRVNTSISQGETFYVEIDDTLGNGIEYPLYFVYTGASSGTFVQNIESGKRYEFVASQGISQIYTWHAAVDSNKTVTINLYTQVVGAVGYLKLKVSDIQEKVHNLEWESSADFLSCCTKKRNFYVRFSNGGFYSTSVDIDVYWAIIPDRVKSFRVYSAGQNNQTAAIAFYSSKTEQSANTYLATYAVRNAATPTEIEVDVPAGALSVAFTNYPPTVAEPKIKAIGVDFVKADGFGNTEKVITQDIFSETYPHVNVLPIADYVTNRWIRFSDGGPVSSNPYFGYYKIAIEDWMKKIVVKSYLGDSNPAAIAFYSSDTPSSDSYLSTSSLQAVAGTNYYYSEIPANAVCFCVTHRNDIEDEKPIIEVVGQGGVSAGFVEMKVGARLISSRRAAAVTGSAISLPIDLSSYEIGTHFLLKIITASGANKKTAALMGDIYLSVLSDLKTGESYYFERTSEVSRIRLYCSSGTNEIIDYDLYVVGSTLNNNNMLLQPNTLSLKQGSIELGEPLQGKYWVTPTTTNTNGSWVCFPIQYSRGYSIHINIDFETYYLSLALWRDDLSGYSEINITEETDYYIPTFVAAWHIAVRRIDRAYVAAETVIDALTCSFVAGSGYKWEKPAPVSYVESLFNEVKQNDSASTQVGNPFLNKPWIAHYSPNGFIKDGNGNNVIASESLADVEMAARLGFSFIEANIQQTSDGNYIVTHGNAGTFGNEVKSADESVITTADLQATAIYTKTLSWIKTYVRYNSILAKYQTTIPTLEEFCVCCKENNIGVFGGTNQRDAIDVMVKHLGIDGVIIYNPPADIRDYFKGMLFQYKSTGATADSMLADAKSFGCPYMCGLSQSLYAEMLSNDELNDFLKVMNYNGFLVGHSYLSEADARAAFRMGFDFAAADHDVNPFKGDKVYDLDGNASDFTTTGSIANNVATLSSGQTISCGSTDFFALAKCSLSIRFNGSLTISLGSKWSSNRTITSDGSELIVITDYCYRRNTVLAITATASTTITELVYKYAIC